MPGKTYRHDTHGLPRSTKATLKQALRSWRHVLLPAWMPPDSGCKFKFIVWRNIDEKKENILEPLEREQRLSFDTCFQPSVLFILSGSHSVSHHQPCLIQMLIANNSIPRNCLILALEKQIILITETLAERVPVCQWPSATESHGCYRMRVLWPCDLS